LAWSIGGKPETAAGSWTSGTNELARVIVLAGGTAQRFTPPLSWLLLTENLERCRDGLV
jgi:hypothetical protein